MIYNTPIIKAYVRKEFLRNLEDGHGEFVECYIESVTIIRGRPLLFNIHTIDGAKVARLPLNAFTLKKGSQPRNLSDLQLWSCLSSSGQVIPKSYFKGYEVSCKINKEVLKGTFLFEIEQFTGSDELGGFEDTADQHKTFNIIALEEGNIAALPNNRCLFLDNHFTVYKGIPDYKTNTHYWKTEDIDFSVGNNDKMFYGE
jgi:hypothetical protein